MNDYAVVFIIGGIIGTWAGISWRLAHDGVDKEKAKAETKEKDDEISRLRTQVAQWIGTESK